MSGHCIKKKRSGSQPGTQTLIYTDIKPPVAISQQVIFKKRFMFCLVQKHLHQMHHMC
jgi:hypothetical protein